MAFIPRERKSLLSSSARVQAPWVKVKIGDYTFGVYDRKKNSFGYTSIQYPNLVTSLSIVKVNGQVNQYTLVLTYPVRIQDDPNFIEKVLSSVSTSRKIQFSYGDALSPNFAYKDEEALITGVKQSFNLESGTIVYTVSAVSAAALSASGSFTFINTTPKRPSDEIKRIFKANSQYGLQNIFTGMSIANLDQLIAGDDKTVELETKTNISPLDYVLYLVGCMVPAGSTRNNTSNDIYILNIHDETLLDNTFSNTETTKGPYFTVTRVSSLVEHAEAYEIDIGFPTSSIVLAFEIENQENFSLYYDYNTKLTPEQYTRRLNNSGQWEDVYAPQYTSGNNKYLTRPEDVVWFTKMTKYPISASIKIQGLLRPATLMQYLRLNVIFPGGNKHISSGLYIITAQRDEIGTSGYFTTLSITRIAD
jgi:hypothetical protein